MLNQFSSKQQLSGFEALLVGLRWILVKMKKSRICCQQDVVLPSDISHCFVLEMGGNKFLHHL